MDISSVQTLILSNLSDFATSVLVILGAVLVIGVAYLVFRFGWKSIRWSVGERGLWLGNTFYGSSRGKFGITKGSDF